VLSISIRPQIDIVHELQSLVIFRIWCISAKFDRFLWGERVSCHQISLAKFQPL
jgi:hypothetical protein